MAPLMCNACICCYTAIDVDDIKLLLSEKSECLCIVHDCCLAIDTDHLGIGVVTEKSKGEICKLGLAVCTLGVKKPDTCVSGTSHCLCIKQAQSFPFKSDYVGELVCAWCFIQCAPAVGILKEAPSCSAMGAPSCAAMDR